MSNKPKKGPTWAAATSDPFEAAPPFFGPDTFADNAFGKPAPYDGPLLKGSYGYVAPDFLRDTYGGGQLESVPGYYPDIAMLDGINGNTTTRIAQPVDPGVSPAFKGNPTAKLESAYERDDRVQVNITTSVPWRAICHLIISRQSGVTVTGTGWFAASDVVVTAGHNYLHHTQGGYATRIRIIPAANGQYGAPFGEVEPFKIFAHPRWIQDADPEYDYALIRLPTTEFGRRTGWFGFANASMEFLNGALLNLAGYPYDKPFGTLWYHAGRARVVNERFIAYRLDTEGGQSGAPIFYFREGRRQVLAMHTQGDPTLNKSKWNSGIRVTGEFYNDLLKAIGFSNNQ